MQIIKQCRATPRTCRYIAILALAVLLSACGGGDKKDKPVTAPEKPVVTVSATTKNLKFSWGSVAHVNFYRLLKNDAGTSGYIQVGENITSTTATDTVSVHLQDWLNTLYIVEACNSAGCGQSTPVIATDVMLSAIGTLSAETPRANDYLGYSIALSSDGLYLAMGATNRDAPKMVCLAVDVCPEPYAANTNTGSVFVFKHQAGVWEQQAEIAVAVSTANDNNYFGYSLALSEHGDTLVVGTPFEASAAQGINGARADAGAQESGAVYIFNRSGDAWLEQAYLKASNAEAFDYFGGSLALSADGDMLVVGASGEASKATGTNGDQNDNSIGMAGAVYVFERSNNVWTQVHYLKAAKQVYTTSECFNPSPVRCLPIFGSGFGSSVALSANGSVVAVGAIYDHSNATGINGERANLLARRSGATYVFTKTTTGWQEEAYIKASNTRIKDNFGYRLALSADGTQLAVSSVQDKSSATGVNGDANLVDADSAGAVHVFHRDSEKTWHLSAYLKASNTDAYSEFGSALAFSANGQWLAVGASGEKSSAAGIDGDQLSRLSSGAGAAYLFTHTNHDWTQYRYIKAPAPAANDSFGFSLDLSADGKILAVGSMAAEVHASNAAVVINAGKVFIY